MDNLFYSADKNIKGRDKTMKPKDIGEVLLQEKRLVSELAALMEKEVEDIIGGNVDALEESLPIKQAIVDSIAKCRYENAEYYTQPTEPDNVTGVRALQQELIALWRKVSGLNRISKTLVERRLKEIGEQLKPFINSSKDVYTRSGMVSTRSSCIIKGGT